MAYISDLELITLSSLSESALIKRLASLVIKDIMIDTDPRVLAHVRQRSINFHVSELSREIKSLFARKNAPLFLKTLELISIEAGEQLRVITDRFVSSDDKTKREMNGSISQRYRLLALSKLLPPHVHFGPASYSAFYRDIKIVDKNLVAIAVESPLSINSALVYRIGTYLGKHRLQPHLKTVDAALNWLMPGNIRCAYKYGIVENREVKDLWNNWEDKMFTIHVSGRGLERYPWIEKRKRD